MTELTERGKAFRAAIAGFIGNKLKKAPKGDDGNYATATSGECGAWLSNAVGNVGDARVATHPIRMTHSSIKDATSIYVAPAQLAPREEIGTHSVTHGYTADFAISNSPQVPACQLLLQCRFDDRPLAEWLMVGDADLTAALNGESDTDIAGRLKNALKTEHTLTSSQLAKQIYWLVGDEPADNCQYHLLQPMFSSTLEDALYHPLSRFKDAYFNARGTQKKQPTFADHATYPKLVCRNIGGANPQNVSPLNSVRHGDNYLLASLPPPAWQQRQGSNLLNLDSVFDEKRGAFYWFGEVRQHVRDLSDFLKTDPDANQETRDRVKHFARALGEQLALFGAAIRGQREPGWTRDADCRLPLCEQLWLDPERTELSERDDPEHPHWHEDDLAFNQAYVRGDWADQVATRFGLWLNGALRERSDKLIALGDAEMRHFASNAVLDVAWPIPLQRRATEVNA